MQDQAQDGGCHRVGRVRELADSYHVHIPSHEHLAWGTYTEGRDPALSQFGRIQILVETLNNVVHPTRFRLALASVRLRKGVLNCAMSPRIFLYAHIVQGGYPSLGQSVLLIRTSINCTRRVARISVRPPLILKSRGHRLFDTKVDAHCVYETKIYVYPIH